MELLKKIACLLICLCCLGFLIQTVGAEERNIYIGDLITVEIKSREVSREEISEAFSEFEIVDIKETKGGYTVTFRGFEPGEKRVIIENQELVITIHSTLTDIDHEGIFEGTLTPYEPPKPLPWFILYFVFPAVFLVSGLILLFRRLKIRKQINMTPYERFCLTLSKIDIRGESCLETMTGAMKLYFEELFRRKIIGKTTVELMEEIRPIEGLIPYREAIEYWLKYCDICKFSGTSVSLDQKNRLMEELKKLTYSVHMGVKP